MCLGIFLSSGGAIAQEEPVKKPSSWEKYFIKGNISISEWFDSLAEGLDLFLAGRKITSRTNDSAIQIENSTVSQSGKALTNSSSLGVRLQLPNLEEYWKLKFTTYDEQEDKRNLRNRVLRQTVRERNYGATVGVYRKLGQIRTSFEPRIELQDPLKVSHSLTFESVADMKTYEINPKLEFYANATTGTGVYQSLNFNFQYSKTYSMTLINQGDYQEKTHLYSVTNGVSFGHVLTEKSSLSYNFIFNSNNQPNYHLEAYNFSISCHQLIYKKILDFQIIPNWDFQEDLGFRGVPGLTVNFNFNF